MQPETCFIAKATYRLLLTCMMAATAATAEENTTYCQTGSPATPVEQFRTIGGQGTFEMWPANFRPTAVGQTLPANRDSTQFVSNSSQLPGFGGLEFFFDLDILEDAGSVYLYMAFNSGFQIWDITGANATQPVLRSARNGWTGQFHFFTELPTENYFPIQDIDAIDPPGAPGETLVAIAASWAVGPSIWDASNKSGPFQLYQDAGKVAIQVANANIGGRAYGFFAANNGVHVYDLTRAREVGPCFENTNIAVNLCGGNADPVWRGRLEPWPWGRARYVDVIETTTQPPRHFLVVSDGFVSNPLGVEIREITDAASVPPASMAIVEGLSTVSFGVDLFEISGKYYLGAVNAADLEIFDVTPCITQAGSCNLNNPLFERLTAVINKLPDFSYVQFSESNGRPFLYKGYHILCSRPPSTSEPDFEMLLDLSGLATGGPVVDVRGEEYLDPGHSSPQRRIDYWTSYYDQSTGGFSTVAPRNGRFHGAYFYRAAQSMFDIHEWIEPETETPPDLIFADGFESGDVSRWE